VALEQQIAEEQGVTVVALAGQLDSRAAPDFEKALLKLLGERKHEILLDLAGLEYVASAGLRVFVMIGKRLQAEGGRLALCSLSAGVMKVLEISGFVQLFPILPDRREAIPWLLAHARAGRISSLAGEILRRDAGSARPAAPGGAAREKAGYAADLLRGGDPGSPEKK